MEFNDENEKVTQEVVRIYQNRIEREGQLWTLVIIRY